jgi:hypothetical protein
MESRLDVGFLVYDMWVLAPTVLYSSVGTFNDGFCLPYNNFSIVSSVSDPLSFHTDPDSGEKSHKEVKKQ